MRRHVPAKATLRYKAREPPLSASQNCAGLPAPPSRRRAGQQRAPWECTPAGGCTRVTLVAGPGADRWRPASAPAKTRARGAARRGAVGLAGGASTARGAGEHAAQHGSAARLNTHPSGRAGTCDQVVVAQAAAALAVHAAAPASAARLVRTRAAESLRPATAGGAALCGGARGAADHAPVERRHALSPSQHEACARRRRAHLSADSLDTQAVRTPRRACVPIRPVRGMCPAAR